jgi:hypothetical protein
MTIMPEGRCGEGGSASEARKQDSLEQTNIQIQIGLPATDSNWDPCRCDHAVSVLSLVVPKQSRRTFEGLRRPSGTQLPEMAVDDRRWTHLSPIPSGLLSAQHPKMKIGVPIALPRNLFLRLATRHGINAHSVHVPCQPQLTKHLATENRRGCYSRG